VSEPAAVVVLGLSVCTAHAPPAAIKTNTPDAIRDLRIMLNPPIDVSALPTRHYSTIVGL
jgi:hypothetical protein